MSVRKHGWTRRDALAGAALSASTLTGAAVFGFRMGGAGQTTNLAIFDSRIAESRVFARQLRSEAVLLIDLAAEQATTWRSIRSAPCAGGITGLTGWSDWVALRGILEARGFRLVDEARVPAPISGRTHLFRWRVHI